jgi:NADH:ubiquinone reductase (H+-translocating)
MLPEEGKLAHPHVVILGAGFAGIAAAQKLRKAPVQVTLFDKNNFHTFQPLLYQVATDELGVNEVGYPIRELLHKHDNLTVHQTTVTGIDLAARQVTVEGMAPLTYDYLVVALGAVVNFFGTAGADENAFPLYTMHDAVRLKKQILETFEAVDKDPSLVKDGALTFVVVGGGATGVEVAGAMAGLFRGEFKKDFPNLPAESVTVVLVEHGPTLLGPFRPNLQEYAAKMLKDVGVQVRTGEAVAAIEPGCVKLGSGQVLSSRTVVWAAGVQANPLATSLGLGTARGGRIPANLDLTLKDHPEVYIAGDVGMLMDAKTNKALPQLGSVAQQAGRLAGENIGRAVKGRPGKPFEYLDKGTMAMIGRGAAVVELPVGEHTMSGHAAWLAWLGIHLVLMSGEEQRASTVVDWGWNTLTHGRTKRVDVD